MPLEKTWTPVSLTWFSYDFSTGPLWNFHGKLTEIKEFSMVFPWVFLWIFHGNMWADPWKTYVTSWIFPGSNHRFPWKKHGFPMSFHWYSFDIPVGFL